MHGFEKLFSERNSTALVEGTVFDQALPPQLRESISVTLAIHNLPTDSAQHGLESDGETSDRVAEPLKMLAGRVGLCHSSPEPQDIWPPLLTLLHRGPAEQVFDIVELMYGALPAGRKRAFTAQINYALQTAGQDWRLFRGQIMKLDFFPIVPQIE